MWFLKYLISALLILTVSGQVSASSQAYFGRAQNFIEEYQGAPLISANWEGRFRPYLYSNAKFKSLFSADLSKQYALTDFYSPTPIDATYFLIYGESVDRKERNIYLFNSTNYKLDKIAPSNEDLVSGYYNKCVLRNKALISYPKKTQQYFYQVNTDAATFTEILPYSQAIPRFEACIWAHEKQLLGALHTVNGYQMAKCDLVNDKMKCGATNAFSAFEDVIVFFKEPTGKIGVIALKKGEPFRKAYLFSDDYSVLTELPLPEKWNGDILDVESDAFRIGSEGRYYTNLTSPSSDATITQFKKIGTDWFAIAADPYHARTLAILESKSWRMLPYSSMPPTASIALPEEIWTTSAKGERYQSFYYGEPKAKKIVLWLHGGPHESFSPRFHPYIYDLNKMGYGVLAVNYPGSTGRGFKYENTLDEFANIDCLESVFQYLKKNNTEQVIIWSISYADKLQKELLENNLPISAIVDQVGILPPNILKNLAQTKNIPYFSIRGKYDQTSIANTADFFYEDGHDINDYHDYDRLMEKLPTFFGRAKPWVY